MIYYFSGTGNSAFVAEQVAKACGDELFSVNQALKKGARSDVCTSERPHVFVTPTYSWRIPRLVEEWIRLTEFRGSKDAYFLLTCGSESGNAVQYVRALCEEKDFRFCGFADFVMPENYTALFTCPEPPEANEIVSRAYGKLLSLLELLQEGKALPPHQARMKFLSLISPIFYALFVKAKKFTVSDACIHCGQCVDVCPLNNVSMCEQKVQFGDHCTHCMACINHCPTQAIDYGKRTKGKHRFLFSRDIDRSAYS